MIWKILKKITKLKITKNKSIVKKNLFSKNMKIFLWKREEKIIRIRKIIGFKIN